MATHPLESLKTIALENKKDISSEEFAKLMDSQDKLCFRTQFNYPKIKDYPFGDASLCNVEDDCVYLCGNSLGLQPKQTKEFVNVELDKWAKRGVVGHFDDSERPWVDIGDTCVEASAKVVGAKPVEVAIMNSLTVNLHLLLISFFRPTAKRYKILLEGKAFPSDHYAVESQLKLHGLDPKTSMILAWPREGENTLRNEDIIRLIEEHGESLAVVIFSGVQFYTGQLFDLEGITKAGHAQGAIVGFDLAHAVGNVHLKLHDWGVDFACWCTYKYLNAGPGGIAGLFVHEKFASDFSIPVLSGWWGHNPKTRFEMKNDFEPSLGAARYQLSNPPVLQTVSLLASLNVFSQTTMEALRGKSLLLTSYLEHLLQTRVIDSISKTQGGEPILRLLTPSDPAQRGCQLSLLFRDRIKPVFEQLEKRGIIVDMREPNVLRVAPAPLYNTYHDVYRFVEALYVSILAV